MLTVYDNDTISQSGLSDMRSQRSRRSVNPRANVLQSWYGDDNHSAHNVNLYDYIIQEEDDENDFENEED